VILGVLLLCSASAGTLVRSLRAPGPLDRMWGHTAGAHRRWRPCRTRRATDPARCRRRLGRRSTRVSQPLWIRPSRRAPARSACASSSPTPRTRLLTPAGLEPAATTPELFPHRRRARPARSRMPNGGASRGGGGADGRARRYSSRSRASTSCSAAPPSMSRTSRRSPATLRATRRSIDPSETIETVRQRMRKPSLGDADHVRHSSPKTCLRNRWRTRPPARPLEVKVGDGEWPCGPRLSAPRARPAQPTSRRSSSSASGAPSAAGPRGRAGAGLGLAIGRDRRRRATRRGQRV